VVAIVSGERTRLACCRWRLANDFFPGTESISAGRRSPSRTGVAREARALPGKDSPLKA